MGEFFGDVERLVADLYPYRWPIGAVVLIELAVIATFAYRKGWHRFVLEHQTAAALIGVPAVVVVVAAGWYLGSPLFISKTVDEPLPFDLAAMAPAEGDATESSEANPVETSRAGPEGADATAKRTGTATPAPTNTPAAVSAPAESSDAYEYAAATPTPTAEVPASTSTPQPSPTPSPTGLTCT
jgi:hypothetical protein